MGAKLQSWGIFGTPGVTLEALGDDLEAGELESWSFVLTLT